jgi:hypothetical protein
MDEGLSENFEKEESLTSRDGDAWPILSAKDYAATSIFQPQTLLREARRQKNLPLSSVPEVCLLDPDGDIVRFLKRTDVGRVHDGWACYHTELIVFDLKGIGEIGVVGCAVGASRPTLGTR